MSYIIGLDIGGTFVKGIALKEGKSLYETEIPTVTGDGIADCLEELTEKLVLGCGAVFSQVVGVGVGCPGVIASDTGTVVRAANLDLENYPLKAVLQEKLGIEVRICNDANAAALGEARFGAGKGYSDSVLITLGTGVGGGIVLGGKLFEGNRSAGAEIGHMVIERNGYRCSCGRYGCFEVYCSARALTQRTKEAMEDDTASAMWKTYTYDTVDGRTAFEYMDTDSSARKVVDRYLKYLACGVANIANIFRPQVIMIGGGLSAQGTRLTGPLQALVDKEIFVPDYAPVEIKCASLGNRAGAYGAAALFLE